MLVAYAFGSLGTNTHPVMQPGMDIVADHDWKLKWKLKLKLNRKLNEICDHATSAYGIIYGEACGDCSIIIF